MMTDHNTNSAADADTDEATEDATVLTLGAEEISGYDYTELAQHVEEGDEVTIHIGGDHDLTYDVTVHSVSDTERTREWTVEMAEDIDNPDDGAIFQTHVGLKGRVPPEDLPEETNLTPSSDGWVWIREVLTAVTVTIHDSETSEEVDRGDGIETDGGPQVPFRGDRVQGGGSGFEGSNWGTVLDVLPGDKGGDRVVVLWDVAHGSSGNRITCKRPAGYAHVLTPSEYRKNHGGYPDPRDSGDQSEEIHRTIRNHENNGYDTGDEVDRRESIETDGGQIEAADTDDWQDRADELEEKGGVPPRRAEVLAYLEAGATHTQAADYFDTSRGNISNMVADYDEQLEESRWLAEHGPRQD